MCCQPDHIGPPPEWHRDHDDAVFADYPRLPPTVALAAILPGLPELGPRPVSTEGGHGRAVPTWRRQNRVPVREDDWAAAIEATPDGWADPRWAVSPHRLRGQP